MIIYLGYFLLLTGYLLYIQFSPGMGNIWYRNGEYFSPMGAVRMLISPFQERYMWNIEFWDLNFVIWSLLFFGMLKIQTLYITR